ncbi:Eukaryotic rRNA processing protein EBP2 [Gracilaria domingensis]|nr:Eukaryotic rRNA processing protein EBP2 [Gracilaria domingensis]
MAKRKRKHGRKASVEAPLEQQQSVNDVEMVSMDPQQNEVPHVPADESPTSDDDGDAVVKAAQEEATPDFSNLVGVGDHSDESDDDAPLEAVAISKLPSETIKMVANDEAALEKKLCEIAIFSDVGGKKPLPFEQSLVVTMSNEQKLSDKLALEDLEREKKFAELTTGAVHLALDKLRNSKVKFRRPADYFAEMVKSDAQMAKIKTHVLQQKERIEDAEKRRNNRDIKKSRKKLRGEQLEREQEKKRKAKEEIQTYSRLRKQRLKEREQAAEDDGGDDGEDEFPIDLLDVEQLDSDNHFQKHADIVSGKKKPWRPTARQGDRNKTPHANGGVKKPRGKKKRLGKSRRMAKKS